MDTGSRFLRNKTEKSGAQRILSCHSAQNMPVRSFWPSLLRVRIIFLVRNPSCFEVGHFVSHQLVPFLTFNFYFRLRLKLPFLTIQAVCCFWLLVSIELKFSFYIHFLLSFLNFFVIYFIFYSFMKGLVLLQGR